MTPEPTARSSRGSRRLLRGLRVQLLLWTILPLAAVLIVLSLAGVTRHRQAMTRLVEDRDRGVAAAEANRLGREVAQQAAALARLAAALPPTDLPTTAADQPLDSIGSFTGGLAWLDDQGALVAASRGQHAADDEPGDADDSVSPGLPPAPAPGDQQRQEWDDHDEEQGLNDDTQGDESLMVDRFHPGLLAPAAKSWLRKTANSAAPAP